jgi:hypothetical protein
VLRAPHRDRAVHLFGIWLGRTRRRHAQSAAAVALVLACFGIVLYNIALSALAFGLLVLSFARRAPEPD